jgi:hypothetical protein
MADTPIDAPRKSLLPAKSWTHFVAGGCVRCPVRCAGPGADRAPGSAGWPARS